MGDQVNLMSEAAKQRARRMDSEHPNAHQNENAVVPLVDSDDEP